MSIEKGKSLSNESNEAQDDAGRQLKEMTRKVESQESKENVTHDVSVYAIESTKTVEDSVSKQGFGSSKKLESPVKSVTYHWERGSSSNGMRNIEDLARNFSYNYMSKGHDRNTKLQEQDKPLSLNFSPSEKNIIKTKESYDGIKNNAIARELTDEEQEKFLEAFRQQNKELAEKQK